MSLSPGLDKERGTRFPTTEVVGYCHMSLRDMSAIYLLQIGGLHPNVARGSWEMRDSD